MIGKLSLAQRLTLIAVISTLAVGLVIGSMNYSTRQYEDLLNYLTQKDLPNQEKVAVAYIEFAEINGELFKLLESNQDKAHDNGDIYRRGRLLIDRLERLEQHAVKDRFDLSGPESKPLPALLSGISEYKNTVIMTLETVLADHDLTLLYTTRIGNRFNRVNDAFIRLQESVRNDITEDIRDNSQSIREQLILLDLATALLVALLVGLSLRISLCLVRQHRYLADSLDRLRQGDTDAGTAAPIDDAAFAPLQAALDAFRNTLRDLRASEHSLAEKNLALEQKAAELAEARNTALRASEAKSQFLATVSHELRTPMNVILGFAQLLESDPGAPLAKPQEDSVQQILKAGWHLLQLINEVLDLARIEAGRIELSLENVNLVEVLDECRAHITPLAERRGIALHEQTGDAVSCLVHADRTRLKQVLLNLLTNAVKYNRDGGSISLALEFPAEDRVRLKVADTGIGLTEAQQGRLFEPFNRLGAERSEVEGCGIGLTIVRHLMELMGGGIGVESAPGTGSTFWIDLGLGAEAHLPDEARAARPATPGQEALPQRTVLYVEDNPANLKLVAQLLARRPDLRLISTHSADLGLEMARAQRPDLIILDINLPGMDGFEARARLRLYPETAEIPVIALSASAMPKDVERGLAAGFLRYLTKPIRIDRFLRTLDDILDDIQPAGRVPAQHESAGT